MTSFERDKDHRSLHPRAIQKRGVMDLRMLSLRGGTAAVIALYSGGCRVHFRRDVLKDAPICPRGGTLGEVQAIAGTLAEVLRTSHHWVVILSDDNLPANKQVATTCVKRV